MGPSLAAVALIFVAACHLQSAQAQNQAPTWVSSSYEVLSNPGIAEDVAIGTSVATLKCQDPENDQIAYRILSAETFRIDTITGVLTVVKNITFDPEFASSGIEVSFECVDINAQGRPARTSWTLLRTKYTVNDVNTEAPIFTTDNPEGYYYTVREDAPIGTLLLPSITLRDNDYTQQNTYLNSLYFICDSPDPLVRDRLTETSRRTCNKFDIRFNRIQGKIGDYNATVFLKDTLDYETWPVYNSRLVAVDGLNVRSLSTTINIQIVVQDTQDQPPVFTNPGASTSISEGTPVGTTLDFGVSARDGDRGALRPVTFELYSDPRQLFSLAPPVLSSISPGVYTSRLVVRNDLDRENITDSYQLGIRVIELDNTVDPPTRTGATATSTYSVFVTDINDNGPTFDQSIYNTDVIEFTNINRDTYIATTISGLHMICTDLDEGPNGDYKVSIVSQTFPNAFSISPQRASFRGVAHLFLQVDDFTYMDYDVPEYRNQMVVLVAEEINTQDRFSSSAVVNIRLIDVNDNRPVFSLRNYTIDVSENVKTFPFSLLNFTVTDADSQNNGQIVFSIDDSVPDRFALNPVTGELTLVAPLDFETNQQYVFLVTATDQSEDPKSNQAQVTVNVLDFNDLGPVFTQPSWETSANESSLSFLNPITIRAIDEDPNARITYSLVSGQSPNNAFFINENTGQLRLTDFLDYDQTPVNANGEKTGEFNLIVRASDNGVPVEQTNVVPVTVKVIDENNHPPELDPTIYRNIVINELAPGGTFVTQIKGTDLDAGVFGQISYNLGPGSSNNFQVDRFSGNVTVAPQTNFDYETTKSYTLTILATDGGAPQRSATATVFVDITDANNKPPFFPQFFYPASVNEDAQTGFPVLSVTARDTDSSARLNYSIIRSSIQASDGDGNPLRRNNNFGYDFTRAFAINPSTGQIFVNSALDRSAAQDISFQVQVEDLNSESGPQTDIAQVTIIVEGEPDSTIRFDRIPIAFVDEDEDIGHSIVTLIARDPLTGRIITRFEKLPGSSSYMDVRDGRVLLARKLDYEKDARTQLVIVRATSDDGLRQATSTVTVSVLDVNDNLPKFQRDSYFAEVSEFAQYPTFVERILATDEDSSSFGPISYRITGGLDAEDFTLLEFGEGAEVLVAEGVTLDYNRRPLYQLTVEAVDNSQRKVSSTFLTSTVSLTIRVIDENNNVPYFQDNKRSYVVPETAEIGQNVSTVRAFDDDSGENGRISYSLLPAEDDGADREGLRLFGISSSQGRIFVAGNLLGRGGSRYNLRVQARDNGRDPNSGFMSLEITVLSTEDNDGNPKWLSPNSDFVVYAPEETPGYQLTDLQFEVTPQTGNSVTFGLSTFIEGYENFSINKTTGLITIVGSLDREVKAQYELHVIAEDVFNGISYRTGRTFILRLLDKNDNNASFTNPRGYGSCGEPISRPLVVPVMENTPANTTVYQMNGCDPDGSGNNGVTYSLYEDNDQCREAMINSSFRLTPNGRLITNIIIDYEQKQEFYMCVKVTSNVPAPPPANSVSGGRKKRAFDITQVPEMNDVAIVWIQIIDQNDHGPEFPNRIATAVVRDSPGNSPVHVLDAVDKDGPGYNVIVYQIQKSVFYPGPSDRASVVNNAFMLRGNRGAIFPNMVNYEQYVGGRFELRILATDSVDSTKNAIQTLIIYVYKKGEAMKLILNDRPEQGLLYAEDLIKDLDNVDTRYVLEYISASENRMTDGVNLEKTDVCFIAVDTDSKAVLNIREVIELLNQEKYKEVLDDDPYKVENQGKCYPSIPSEDKVKWKDLWWVLVAVAIFLFVCCLIAIVLISVLYRNYKQYMETRKTYLVQQ